MLGGDAFYNGNKGGNQVKKLLSVLLAFALASFGSQAVLAAEDNSSIEEVVVTGSYLKRTAADSPSPLSVVSSADIEDLGAVDVGEVISAMPWASGSQVRATTFGGEGADGRRSVNLRNLGHGSTLPLVNGKRHVASWYNPTGNSSVNVNALVPNIALERVEIVKDGASALYGSDAVAGVVNFITKDDFEGFDMRYSFSTDDESGEGDTGTLEVIFGARGDRGGVVVAASAMNRDEINVGDRWDRFGGSTISSTGQPGRFFVLPNQTIRWRTDNPDVPNNLRGTVVANGTDTMGNSVQRIPMNAAGTAYRNSPTTGVADTDCATAAGEERAGTLGVFPGNGICLYDFGPFFALQAEESLRNTYVMADYELTSSTTLYAEFASSSSEFDRLNSLNPNSPALEIPIDHPGNEEDAYRRGIDPIRMRNGTRMIGLERGNSDRPIDTFTDTSRRDERMLLGTITDLELGGRPWTLDVSYAANQYDAGTTQVQDTLSSHMELAINGLGGPECDVVNGTPGEGNTAYKNSMGDFDEGKCYYFNPFGSNRWARDGTRQTDLELVNPPELIEWLLGRANSDATYKQRVLDGVFAGEIFDIGSSPAQLAIGFQRRVERGRVNYSAALNTNNLDFSYGAGDWSGELTITSLFMEMALPVTDWMDINIAARYEDFDELDESSSDPKITILMRPTDEVSVRVSAGSSFRVPSLQQLFGSLTTVANQTSFDGATAFRPSISTGNPKLVPEEADSWNIGVSWQPSGAMEGFLLDFDLYSYEYENIITRESSQALLNADNAAINAYIMAAAQGTTRTARDAITAGEGNRRQIIRTSEGNLLRILPDFVNANSATIEGMDLTASYSFDTRAGSWRVGTQLAYVTTYDIETGTTTHDAIGKRNLNNPVARALPEYKVNATLNWSLNRHRAFMLVRHVPEVDDNSPTIPAGFLAVGIQFAHGADKANDFRTTAGAGKIEKMTTVDVQYTYNIGELFNFISDSNVTVGIMNLFNEEAPWVVETTAHDPTLHDPRGRVFMVRFGASM